MTKKETASLRAALVILYKLRETVVGMNDRGEMTLEMMERVQMEVERAEAKIGDIL